MDQLLRCIHKGTLMKRCRMSWRPRYVEMVMDPGFIATGHASHQLILYDQHRHMIKNRISFEDMVTVRSSRDCNIQVFMSDRKILQFRTESVESQAHWMAALKVGLGKGHIFHVRVHTSNGLDHALLYSIGVNLPAHRVGQLDRVLVLASPINDININAWDLNRVKFFMESDVGIRMELCPGCIRGDQSERVTFIIDKKFINDCMQFLLREARIREEPHEENGLKIYNVPHQCGYIKQPDSPAPPPPPPLCTENNVEPQSFSQTSQLSQSSQDNNSFYSPTMGTIKPAYPIRFWDDSNDSGTGSFSGGSEREFTFPTTSKSLEKINKSDFRLYLPPRTIPRLNYESCIPAQAQPYIKYQPHMYQQGHSHFEAPYQISSRIIITDSGEVQFERNIMGNVPPQENGGILVKKQLPLPPRGLVSTKGQHSTAANPSLSHTVNLNMESTVSTTVKNSTRSRSLTKEEVQPTLNGAHFPGVTTNRKGSTPPPEVPPHPLYNLNQERFMSTAPGGHLIHRPLLSRETGNPPTKVTHAQPATSQHLLTTLPSRLPQSASESGLAKASNFSITTLFPKKDQNIQRPVLHKQSLKRTSSDSELTTFPGRSASRYGNGNQARSTASLKRASQVSDTSDVYVIPTPPSSTTSLRESDTHENPISPSYVRETDFLGKTTSFKPDEDDSAFLSEADDDKEHDYENEETLQKMREMNKNSESEYYDDIWYIREKMVLNSGISISSAAETSDLSVNTSLTTKLSLQSTRGDSQAKHVSTTRPSRPKKPLPHPKKATPHSTNCNVPEPSSLNVAALKPEDPLPSHRSPSHVAFYHQEEQVTSSSNKSALTTLETRTLPRKSPVPKPRKLGQTLTTKMSNLTSLSHLSTSDSDLQGDYLSQSLGLQGTRYLSKSTHTILYNGIEVGVTDL